MTPDNTLLHLARQPEAMLEQRTYACRVVHAYFCAAIDHWLAAPVPKPAFPVMGEMYAS